VLPPPAGRPDGDDSLKDALVGGAAVTIERMVGAGRLVGRVAGPGARLLLDPPVLPKRMRPKRAVAALVRRGRAERLAAARAFEHAIVALVPALVSRLIELLPLTDLIRDSVDLDVLVGDVDLDAVAARIDLDAVAGRLDINAILDRLDLTTVVNERVDINAVAGTIDVDSIIDRIDLVTLAQDVIAAVDLPEIVRQSSGSLASETVRSVRMQSIEADRAVERLVDRLLARRRPRPDGHLPTGATT
jgi:hypothetical protein